MDSEKELNQSLYVEAFRSARNIVNKEGYNIIFMALHGSQNYQLDTEESDFDWYVAVEPRFNDFVHEDKLISRTIQYLYGIITIKDIREMMNMIKKGGFNFLEILFSQCLYVNPRYEKVFSTLINNRNNIAYSNKYATIKSYIGCASNIIGDGTKDINNKKCAQILTISNHITSYAMGEPFDRVLTSEKIYSRDFIKNIKTGTGTKEYLKILSNVNFDYIHNYGTSYLRNNPDIKVDKESHNIIDNILYETCKLLPWVSINNI